MTNWKQAEQLEQEFSHPPINRFSNPFVFVLTPLAFPFVTVEDRSSLLYKPKCPLCFGSHSPGDFLGTLLSVDLIHFCLPPSSISPLYCIIPIGIPYYGLIFMLSPLQQNTKEFSVFCLHFFTFSCLSTSSQIPFPPFIETVPSVQITVTSMQLNPIVTSLSTSNSASPQYLATVSFLKNFPLLASVTPYSVLHHRPLFCSLYWFLFLFYLLESLFSSCSVRAEDLLQSSRFKCHHL